MINIYHAAEALQQSLQAADNEREVIRLVMDNLDQYALATRVKHSELDIVFAATGGPTNWVNVDNMSVEFEPEPARASEYGDILVERANGYVNLSTPAGFIPLVDAVEQTGSLKRKLVN